MAKKSRLDPSSLHAAIGLLCARDWEGAHVIVQEYDEPLASWAHGIVHLIEGDESNARYWYKLAAREFPGMDAIDAEIDALRVKVPRDAA